jgi:tetratricopeptide (TPR) repeat protein
MAWVLCARGELDAARRYAELGLVWARRHPEVNEVKLLLVAVEISMVAADYAQTEHLLQQARERARMNSGNRRDESNVLLASGDLAQRLGDWQEGLAYAEATLRIAREIGVPQTEGAALMNLAVCCLEQGDAAAALAHAHAATRIQLRIGDRRAQAYCRRYEGLALCASAEWGGALSAFEQALALAATIPDERQVRHTLSSMAQMYLDRGQMPQALAQVERILESRQKGDGDAADLEVALTCHRVLAAALDPRARGLIEDAYAELQALSARIGDASIRERVLNNVSAHREIMAVWKAQSAAPEPAARA